MNALVPLNFDTAKVRMIMRDSEPWWVGMDVARLLELSHPRRSLGELEDYEKGVTKLSSPGGEQDMIVINESGMYSMLFRSRKLIAKRFKRWLTTEVLPSIRKFGMYPPPAADLIASNDPYDGIDKTIPQRFKEERIRWERETGYSFAKVPGFSAAVIRSIEGGMGGTRKKERIETMVIAGLDVRYILTGARNVTPIERGILERLRQNHALMLEN